LPREKKVRLAWTFRVIHTLCPSRFLPLDIPPSYHHHHHHHRRRRRRRRRSILRFARVQGRHGVSPRLPAIYSSSVERRSLNSTSSLVIGETLIIAANSRSPSFSKENRNNDRLLILFCSINVIQAEAVDACVLRSFQRATLSESSELEQKDIY